jgi:hypothetical protein
MLQGSSAMLTFVNCCSDFDQIAMLVTDFDEDSFQSFDQFEACVYSSINKLDQGGKTALFCMIILCNANDVPDSNVIESSSTTSMEAIADLASFIFRDTPNFCKCVTSEPFLLETQGTIT